VPKEDIMSTGRVVVGVDGSPAGLRALWMAVEEARRRAAPLYVVNSPAIYGRSAPAVAAGLGPMPGVLPIEPQLTQAERDRGMLTVDDAFMELFGGWPPEAPVHVLVSALAPGPALVNTAGPDDLLVVGRSRGGFVRRLVSGSISKYCVTFARCPVIVVPAPPAPQRSYSPRHLRRQARNGR
jgi:nucleotide-binding universal stress UspA family protein